MNSDVTPSSVSEEFTICDFSPSNLRIIDALLRSSPDIIMVTDREGRFAYVGLTAATIFERSPESILGKTTADLDFPAALQQGLEENQSKVLLHERSVAAAIAVPTGRGVRSYEFTFSPVGDSERETCAVLCVGRDVTDQLVARNERRLLAAIVESSDDAIIGKDLDGIIVSWNRAAEAIFGYAADEIIGKPKSVLFPPDRLSEETEILRRVRAGERTDYFETVRLRKDGVLIDVSVTISPIRDASGAVAGASTIIRDITQQKRMERQLQQREARHRALLESITQMLWVSGAEGNVLEMSPRWTAFTGQTDVEAQGNGWTQVVHPEDVGLVVPILRLAADEKVAYSINLRVRRPDGEYRNMVARGVPILDTAGEVREWVGTFDDVTDTLRAEELRKRAEAERQASEAALYAILDNAPVSIFTKDTEGRYTFINRAAEQLLPASREEMIGRINFDFYPEEAAAAFFADDLQVIETGFTILREADYSLADGSHTFITLKFPLYDRNQTIYAVCSMITDVTERKQLQAQLYQAQKMESIGRLAGGIAHDFNNLLTAIMGYTELAELEAEPGSPILPHLQTVQQTAQRAAALTGQLLAFARKQILEPRVFSLNDLMVEIDKLLRRVLAEDIELITLPAADLQLVKADPNQITQVLLNLAVNARDAMPGGGKLTIETQNVVLDANYARQHAEVQPGAYVMMSVSDTGIGMTAEVQARLFEPFFTTKEPGKGTGLGLATCYGIIKQNGGHIWVYSEPGQGASFKVYLPIVNEPASVLHSSEISTVIPVGTETILIAEDEPLLRGLAAEILQAQGYRVLVADNGSAALRLAAETSEEIHLLVTDVVMPYMGGQELSARLTALRPDMKVLYVSGHTENTIVHHGILDPGIAFLQKPYMLTALARKVRDVLDAASQGEPTA